jgi:hypothetical protein
MRRYTLLAVLNFTSSALCWWPVIVQPNLDLSPWLPLVLVGLGAGLSTILSDEHRLRFVLLSVAGTFAGMFGGFMLLPLTDAIEAAYSPFAIGLGTALAIPVAFVCGQAGLTLRSVLASNERRRRAVWVALASCVAFGPVTLLLTPPLVAYKVRSNDRIAAQRFESLKSAIDQTWAEAEGQARICDGQALKRHYAGPLFSESDWRYIVGNYVKRDGYVFGINCHEKVGYALDAHPAGEKGDGSRQFCVDGHHTESVTAWNARAPAPCF